ncbi:hypothetical protein Rhe02_24990 [Rhizocola hellebori]|uniref:Uncharacterized protein n=1 Tax=Rhizocola hellebori TaxID=1392758 RepID=A0A8J3Q6Z7_9ACTN|nr:hypothetical protein [Rhizocola hellebori]GIH04432.1 hypothetical protein Rhe02_24990 [Rhizocola hellebori]
MHPLVMTTSARHRRTLTTPQLLRIAASILLTVAVVAALGVFGGSMATQAKVLQWFSARGIAPGLVGWATYALPLLALTKILSPYSRPFLRVLAYLVFPPALVMTALMSRPRATTTADWKLAINPDFVAASQLAAYALLAAAIIFVISCVITLARSAATTPTDDILIALRRNASRIILFAVGSTLATLILT